MIDDQKFETNFDVFTLNSQEFGKLLMNNIIFDRRRRQF